ncbi:D-alanyl-D-alanine carboxypeptidase/D-alanyl-D-alanine-endopeptidase [Bacillus carboniphilus]|uniref:D-alanyl-D-alanine carboxypeptidase/D-alanyl-D-alanine-endopeptidase n=2 Tax=Bacillus carboniphilus TaxID=86663 RepID=A0ABN0VQK8_9BACI
MIEKLNQLLHEEPILKGALAGISIRSVDTGELLYEHFGDVRLRPASNMKLFTSAAALSTLGENYTFQTELRTDGKIHEGVLKGNLYVKGKGDPTLQWEDIEKLVQSLKELGVKEVHGHLIGDDTWYDDVRYSIDLPWSDETMYYGSQISALTVSPSEEYDTGTVRFEIIPGEKAGEAPTYRVFPETQYIEVMNKAQTVSSEVQEADIMIEREHGTNKMTILGSIPVQSDIEQICVPVWEPTLYVLDLFDHALKQSGIVLKGESMTEETPEETVIIASRDSIPISELLIPFMKLSNNGVGELLTKEMGRVRLGEGSWEKGLEVLSSELKNLGIDTDSLVLRDGSGISHVNLLTTNEISRLLYVAQSQPWFEVFKKSLPVAGEADRMLGGTLSERMTELPLKGKVLAKTGTIQTVTSLSGYVETKTGESLIFSIVLNNLLDEDAGKELEDRLIELIAGY